MPKKPTSVVGLDIGASSIKAVEVSFKGDMPHVERVSSIEIPPTTIRESTILDPETVKDALAKLWKEGGFTSNQVRVAISGEKTVARQTVVPWYEDSILTAILPEQAEDYLPEDKNNYYLDYHTLRESMSQEISPDDEEEKLWVRRKTILIAGAPRKDIDNLMTLLQEANLMPISIDIAPLALLRSHYIDEDGYSQAADVNVDIGAETLTLVIHKFGQPVFIRTVSGLGGRIITERIAEEFNIPFFKAEKRKIDALYSNATTLPSVLRKARSNNSFFASDDGSDVVIASDQLEKTRKIISEQLSEIINTIRETTDNFLYEQQGNDLTNLNPFVLSGGLSATPHFLERLSAEFQKQMRQATPLTSYGAQGLPTEIMAKEYEYAVATGLAAGKGTSHG